MALGKKEQNGTVEAPHGAFKRFLNQQLLRRPSRDFASATVFEQWLQGTLHHENSRRQRRLRDELAVMKPLRVARLPAFKELAVRVSQNSTINGLTKLYSVPPRLMHRHVRVRVYENHLVVCYGTTRIQAMPRLTGQALHAIDYRQVIGSLVQKPGAFARYRYREAWFPTLVFRRTYERLQEALPGIRGDAAYLRILHLAASTQEAEVQAALELLLEAQQVPEPERVKELVRPAPPAVSARAVPEVDLASYDQLLGGVSS
jgi:hypothetical protein